MHALHLGVVILDSYGRIRHNNRAARQTLGALKQGQCWSELIVEKFEPRLDDGHEVSLKNGLWVNLSARPLENKNGLLIVFIILIVILITINFVVVTKGAGRIAQVSARFTLDAMLDKQMPVDADLNAGVIDQEAASARRLDITQEAGFYGAMDGASKFVKCDVIAGILILVINLIASLA